MNRTRFARLMKSFEMNKQRQSPYGCPVEKLRHFPEKEYAHIYFVRSWEPHDNDCIIYKAECIHVKNDALLEDCDETLPPQKRHIKPPEGMKRVWRMWTHQKGRLVYSFVEDDDYRRVIPNPTFSKKQAQTLDKFTCNVTFLWLLLQYHRPQRNIVYLESPCGRTTNELTREEKLYQFGELHVPNPDPDFLKQIRSIYPDFDAKVHYHECTIYEWMRDLDHHSKVYDFGLDFCCTFDGNKQNNKPKQDLIMMFQKKLLAPHNGILWLTFSTRSPKRSSKPAKERCVEVRDWVLNLAKDFGYQIELIYHGDYGKGIFYLFFRTHSNNIEKTIDQVRAIQTSLQPQIQNTHKRKCYPLTEQIHSRKRKIDQDYRLFLKQTNHISQHNML